MRTKVNNIIVIKQKNGFNAQKRENMNSLEFTNELCKLLSDKKAEDIVKIAVGEKSILADYFVIASGRSSTQVRALCEHADEFATKLGRMPKRVEGVQEGRWAVLDFGDVILHIFDDENRLFYHLERLWGEGERFEG